MRADGAQLHNGLSSLSRDRLCKLNRSGVPVPDPIRGGASRTANGAMTIMRALRYTREAEWDASRTWLGAPGGKMLNIITREIRTATSNDLVTRRLGVLPGDHGGNVWRPFLHETIPDNEEREFFLTLMALALAGRGHESQMCLWLTGAPGAGKSLILDVMEYVFGSHATRLPAESLVDTGQSSTAYRQDVSVGNAVGSRLVLVDDPKGRERSAGAAFNATAYRQLTGSGAVTARRNNRVWQAERTWQLAASINRLPSSKDGAEERRTAVCQCPNAHSDREEDKLPKPDRQLVAKLKSAAPAILSDLLERVELAVPDRPESNAELTRFDPPEGSLEAFITAKYVRAPDSYVFKSDAYEEYKKWRTIHDGPSLTQVELGRQLISSKLGAREGKRGNRGKQRRALIGIRPRLELVGS